MLKNEDIICISSIDWDFIWQGHQEIMTQLARAGNRVLYIENTGVRMPKLRDLSRIKNRLLNWKKGVQGIRKIEEGLYVYSPVVLPFPYLKIARFINKKIMFSVLFKWLKAVGFQEPLVWTFLPTGLTLDLINELSPKALIYYCIDSFQASSEGAKKIVKTEKQLIEKADLVFVTSQALFDHCARYSKNVHYFPFGVNVENFINGVDLPLGTPPDIKDIKKPIAGYIGGIHKWIDFDLVKHVAEDNKDVSFVFCGPVQTEVDSIKGLPNVFFLGQKSTRELPFYVKEFDVALIPYLLTDYTKNVYPTKLNEYLSVGKRVISTNLPEVMKFNQDNDNIVNISTGRDSFSRAIKDVLRLSLSADYVKKAVDTAKKNAWDMRIENMSQLITEIEYIKTMEKEKSWSGAMKRFSNRIFRRVLLLIFFVLLLNQALFHTPLLWKVAGPLTVSEKPERSAVIAVMGGGVGESGKVGQGYEERVDKAVNLYNEGYSDQIVYMSGFTYIMKEAEVMKALSIFRGVPQDKIFTDESPVNTYQMISDLGHIMNENGWQSAIIVTSPFHAKRVRLLVNSILKGKDVYISTLENSSFYSNRSRITFDQMKGIIHEYMAILYYKMKGYF